MIFVVKNKVQHSRKPLIAVNALMSFMYAKMGNRFANLKKTTPSSLGMCCLTKYTCSGIRELSREVSKLPTNSEFTNYAHFFSEI